VNVGDVITIRERVHKMVRENMETMAGLSIPEWLNANPSELSVRIESLPTSDQIPFDVDTNLIVEFYR